MNTVFVLYMPGYAGNLINRLISLSPETVPQMAVHELAKFGSSRLTPDLANRLSLYSFNKAKKCSTWQIFHRTCADFANKDLFDFFIKHSLNTFSHIVYAIHPYEFNKYINDIKKVNNSIFYYVSLDKKYNSWVNHYEQRLQFQWRTDELSLHHQFQHQYSMQPIHLDRMLDSQQGFEEEYLRVIADLGLTPELEQARILYAEWLELRGSAKI